MTVEKEEFSLLLNSIPKMNPNQISIIIYDLARRLNVVAKTKRVRLSEVYRWAKEQKDWGSFLFFPDHQSVTDCKKSKVRIFWTTNGSVAIEGDTWLAVGEECAELLDASGIVTVDDRDPDINDVLKKYIVLATFAEEKGEGEDLELIRMTDALRHIRAARLMLKGDIYEIVINSLLDLDEMLSEAISILEEKKNERCSPFNSTKMGNQNPER